MDSTHEAMIRAYALGNDDSPKTRMERELMEKMAISKSYAHAMVRGMIAMGAWVCPELCEECRRPSKSMRAHHENYFQPLRVKWLCASCHKNRHVELRAMGEDPGDSFCRRILESPEGDNYLNRLRQFYIQVAELSTELFDEDLLASPNALENIPRLSLSYPDGANSNATDGIQE